MGSAQSTITGVAKGADGSSFEITIEDGRIITIIVQDGNYAVMLGSITVEEANTFLAGKGFPILVPGSKPGVFRVFGKTGERAVKEWLPFFPAKTVKSFCFAFNKNRNGFTISNKYLNFIIDLAFLELFLGLKETTRFNATDLKEFPRPQIGKAPDVSPWKVVEKTAAPAKAPAPAKASAPISLEEIQDEEAILTAKLSALSLKKKIAKEAAVVELQRLEEAAAKLKLALQNN
jgi:hypothetical protein